jgi:hypothetical protein
VILATSLFMNVSRTDLAPGLAGGAFFINPEAHVARKWGLSLGRTADVLRVRPTPIATTQPLH